MPDIARLPPWWSIHTLPSLLKSMVKLFAPGPSMVRFSVIYIAELVFSKIVPVTLNWIVSLATAVATASLKVHCVVQLPGPLSRSELTIRVEVDSASVVKFHVVLSAKPGA